MSSAAWSRWGEPFHSRLHHHHLLSSVLYGKDDKPSAVPQGFKAAWSRKKSQHWGQRHVIDLNQKETPNTWPTETPLASPGLTPRSGCYWLPPWPRSSTRRWTPLKEGSQGMPTSAKRLVKTLLFIKHDTQMENVNTHQKITSVTPSVKSLIAMTFFNMFYFLPPVVFPSYRKWTE